MSDPKTQRTAWLGHEEVDDDTLVASDVIAGSRMPLQVGKYRVTKWLGTSDTGEVWLGEDAYGNEVVIKLVILAGRRPEPMLLEFLRRGHSVTSLQHRNICRVYAVEEHGGIPFVIREYVEGVDLASLLDYLSHRRGHPGGNGQGKDGAVELGRVIEEIERASKGASPGTTPAPLARTSSGSHARLPLAQVVSVVSKLCDAVHCAHEHGILHRNIKPANIIIRRDGEPVLLDFGMAELAGVAAQTVSSFVPKEEIPTQSQYRAPEQRDSPASGDERSDVYGLGAVLYEMVYGTKITMAGIMGPERRRIGRRQGRDTGTHESDRDLDAIIRKALAPNREQRYRTALALAQDLTHYLEGQPVIAKPPTVFYLVSKFVRRNSLGVALSSIIALLLITLGGYFAIDHYRGWGNWVSVFNHDFISRPHLGDQFEFVDSSGIRGLPWVIDSLGLRLSTHTWCWLKDVRVSGNVRVTIRLHFDDMPDGFEVALNSAIDSTAVWYHVPRGYSCQVGGYLGTLDFVSINKTPGVAQAINPVPSRFNPMGDVEVMFQREGERLSLFVNGRKQSEERDLLPFWGPDFSRIGFRSFATSVHVRDIEVHRMSLPQKASPLVAGDVLASSGYARDAVKVYLGIATDYRGSPLAEKALVRSLHTVYQLGEPFRTHLADSILGMFDAGLRGTDSWQDVREMQILDLWKDGRFESVFQELDTHFDMFPSTRIALELQNVGARVSVPDTVKSRLLEWVTRTRGVTCLNGRGMPQSALELVQGLTLGYVNWTGGELSNVQALSSSRLTWLSVASNRISSVEPLHGQPLAFLDISGNLVSRLDPLTYAPLHTFSASSNFIADISPLRFSPLEYVAVESNRLTNLAALRGKEVRYLYATNNALRDVGPLEAVPLRILACGENRIGMLTPIRGAPLRELHCAWNAIRGLAPLTGMHLRWLDVGGNCVESLEHLAGLPLRRLSCNNNRISDLRPLRGIAIRHLDISHNRIADLAPLSGMPLEFLDCSDNPIADFSAIMSMNLRALYWGGLGGPSLASVAKLELEEFGCRNAGLVDLWPLAEMGLERLDCSSNDIVHLSALAAMPLVNLACSDNAVESLQPLRHMSTLRSLSCARNDIASLEPLSGLELVSLDCSDNPIESLAPFYDNPPQRFLFYTRTLSVEELERASAAWDSDSRHATHSRNARMLGCINGEQFDQLWQFATVLGGHAYLHIPWRLPREEAVEICSHAGGYLLQVEDDEEWFAVRDGLAGGMPGGVWAGVVEADSLQWAHTEGSSSPPRGIVHEPDGEWVYYRGALRKTGRTGRRAFVIEWAPTVVRDE